MNAASASARLARLLPHWAEHAAEHVAEISQWRRQAAGEVGEAVILHMREAEAAMTGAQAALAAAANALAATARD